MTYLFKLSRRTAAAVATWVLPLALLACSEAAPREFLSPDPNGPPPSSNAPVALVVAGAASTLPYDQSFLFQAWGRLASGDSVPVAVNWVASAGQISPDGRYRGTVPGSHTVTAYAVASPSLSATSRIDVSNPGPLFATLEVQPKPVQIAGGARVMFGATARLQSGANTLPTVTWRATGGGTVAPNGEFAAGLVPGTYLVIATTLDGLLSDTASVVIEEAALAQLQLQPKVITLPGGGSQDFQISAAWTDGTAEVPALEWESPAGTVEMLASAAGGPQATPGGARSARFTANTEPGNYKVVVKHRSSGKSDTASVTITPVLSAVEVTPASISLLPGATAAFSAKGRMSDGVQTNVSVSWVATGGTISGSGVYVAGGVPGTYRVIGRLATGTLADTSVVQIAAPAAATLTGLTITPATGTVPVGGSVNFTAGATWSDGSTALPALTWTAQAGSVSAQGKWTAPATAGSYRVIVRHSGGTLADTATYSVVVPPPAVTAISVSPKTPGVQGGEILDFQAQAQWSDGSTTVPALTWSATGGEYNQEGRWRAPNVSGVYRVVARADASGLADTAVVTVAETPWVTSVRVSPRLGALNPGGSVQLTPEFTWSDGQVREVAQTWTATGGTVSMSGLFTAGSLAGQFLVIASCAGCTVADTARFSITEPVVPPPTVTQLVLNPATVSVTAGATQAFQVAAAWSDGSTTVPPLAWTAAGGTMSGLTYTAGTTAGTYTVIVRDAGGTKADTSVVTVTAAPTPPPGPVTVTQLNITPVNPVVLAGGTLQFAATATMSDGTTTTPTIQWSTTVGTIDANGLYTQAGTSASALVIATCATCGRSDTTTVTISAPPPPPSSSVTLPEAPRVFLNTAYQMPTGTVRRVAAGGNLQTVINAAQCGDRILLAAGATFVGNFTLPAKNCTTQWIEISTETTLPPEGVRVTPATAAAYAKIVTAATNQPALASTNGASNYRIMGVEFAVASNITSVGAIVSIHTNGLSNVSQLARDIVFDRVVITGHDNAQVRRCLLMNGARIALVDSYLQGCHYKGADAQAVLLWDTPGPIKVVNNYLEGSGENMMIGGADPSINGMVPADIEIRRNHFFKPMAWYTSGKWTVKNSFELKLGKRVLIEGNIFENNWADAQTGFAVLFKSVNQNGGAPWSETADVMFRQNIVVNSPNGLNFAGNPEVNPAVRMSRVAIIDNLVYRLGTTGSFGGSARGIQMASDVASLTIRNNTIMGSNFNGLLLYSPKSVGTLDLMNNIIEGLINSADGAGRGTVALNAHQVGWQAQGNVFIYPAASIGNENPPGNMTSMTPAAMGFVGTATGNYALSSGSPFARRGTDGRDPGVDFAAVAAATSGVR